MKKPLSVVHVHSNGDWGGGEYQVLNLLAGLVERGVDARLMTPANGALFQRCVDRKLPVEPLPRLFRARKLRAVVAGCGADVLHAHDSESLTLAGGVASRARLPLVLSRRIASPLRQNPRSRRKYSPENVTAIIAISRAVRDVLLQSGYPEDRLFVVPSGLRIDELDKLERDDSFSRLWGGAALAGGIGKLSVKKNWSMMIEVAALLAHRGMDLQWVLAGDGPEHKRLERLAQQRGLSERFHLLGFRPDASQILRNLDLLFFPSLMEGASVTVREAMALGVPVVAVNAPGTMESLDEHGWGVEPGDIQGAADQVARVLTDRGLREAVCARARASAVERFSFPKTVEGTIRAYEAVMARGR